MQTPPSPSFQHVGIIGAGIGGLACAIATRIHSSSSNNTPLHVTILEAASTLGEIGAGIQMTPNVACLLKRWGVAAELGSNLTPFSRLNLRTKDGRVVGTTDQPSKTSWWLVHRMHLHAGLVSVARRHGVVIVTGARVVKIVDSDDKKEQQQQVRVRDESGRQWAFDLVIGADGVNSFTRRTILPEVTPRAPTTNAAYRAVVPMERIRADPVARQLLVEGENTMDVWMGGAAAGGKKKEEHGYVITYPICGGEVLNMVLSHHRAQPVTRVEEDAQMARVLRDTYCGYDARLRRVIELIPAEQGVKRWPLLVTRCPDTWASPTKRIVLLGDAAHSMVNHLAQGAATAMEDGAFLGVVLREVAAGRVALRDAIGKYEEERRPLADVKQQVSFVMGVVYHLEDGSAEERARDRAMEGELEGRQLLRTPNLNADPHLWRTVFLYDPEAHAETAVQQLLAKSDLRNEVTGVTREMADIYMNYWLPDGSLKVKSLL